ncbi:MAG: hypothetical protein N2646_08285, partial [Bellilinea sp.]|nr:hypothetical protein [Bellilinea sp.]
CQRLLNCEASFCFCNTLSDLLSEGQTDKIFNWWYFLPFCGILNTREEKQADISLIRQGGCGD